MLGSHSFLSLIYFFLLEWECLFCATVFPTCLTLFLTFKEALELGLGDIAHQSDCLPGHEFDPWYLKKKKKARLELKSLA